jgi:hypothetical protein
METKMDYKDQKASATSEAVTPEPVKVSPSEKRTAEQWAEHRGHFPQITREAPPSDKPHKVMPAIHNPKFRHYQEARFLNWGGVVGKEMTLEEYDAGVKAALGHVYR